MIDKPEINRQEFISWGKAALKGEAEGLIASAEKIGESFADASSALFSCKGKVIVTGLGKSGHIARKIAATLSSTGTSSFFLHPTEALHGDFGMVTEKDCLVAIAFGGKTPEVVEVARYARRIAIPVIAITGDVDSQLAELSSYVLDGSVSKEVCPLNLAPTTSSTVAMALGDALSVSLMRARGFDEKDFAKLHPGGSIGRRLSHVKTLMHTEKDLPTIAEDAGFHAVLENVTKNNFGIVAVVDSKNEILGCITDGDLRRVLLKDAEKALKRKAKEMMSKKPKMVSDAALAIDAFGLMEKNHITAVFVYSDSNPAVPVGIIRMYDLLNAKIV